MQFQFIPCVLHAPRWWIFGLYYQTQSKSSFSVGACVSSHTSNITSRCNWGWPSRFSRSFSSTLCTCHTISVFYYSLSSIVPSTFIRSLLSSCFILRNLDILLLLTKHRGEWTLVFRIRQWRIPNLGYRLTNPPTLCLARFKGTMHTPF